jgi:hypothetical protein
MPRVDGASNVIPEAWLDLPLVNQPRHLAVEHQGRIHGLPGVEVHVQQYLAGRELPGRRLWHK